MNAVNSLRAKSIAVLLNYKEMMNNLCKQRQTSSDEFTCQTSSCSSTVPSKWKQICKWNSKHRTACSLVSHCAFCLKVSFVGGNKRQGNRPGIDMMFIWDPFGSHLNRSTIKRQGKYFRCTFREGTITCSAEAEWTNQCIAKYHRAVA